MPETIRYNFSLIIPYFNGMRFIGNLLSSIPQREDLQVIIIDDCSTEDPKFLWEIKQRYTWIEWLKTDINRGAGHARNLGLKEAQGKWVLFADSDDYFTENINSILDYYINEECDIVYLNIQRHILDKDYKVIKKSPLRFKENKIEYQQLIYRFTEPWGKLIKREFILDNNISFQESMHGNDIYFSTICDYFMRSYKIDIQPAYIYINRKDSLSHNVTLKERIDRLEIIGGCRMFLYKRGIHKLYWESYLKHQYEHILNQGSLKDISKCLIISGRYKMYKLLIPLLRQHILSKIKRQLDK